MSESMGDLITIAITGIVCFACGFVMAAPSEYAEDEKPADAELAKLEREVEFLRLKVRAKNLEEELTQ